MTGPQTFSEVIKLWPTVSLFAADLGVKEVTARAWKAREIIPAEHWTCVLAAAGKREFGGVTCELLAGLAASRPKPKPRQTKFKKVNTKKSRGGR